MLLPITLAPLVIPPEQPQLAPLESHKFIRSPEIQSSTNVEQRKIPDVDEDGPPPQVPPKSPRMLGIAFNGRSNPTPVGTPNSSHTANSSITSLDSVETPMTAFSAISWSPLTQLSNSRYDPKEKEITASPAEFISPRTQWGKVEQIPKHVHDNASVDTVSSRTAAIQPVSAQSPHSRNGSESSMMSRGRPKRRELSRKRERSKGFNVNISEVSIHEVPSGYKQPQAMRAIPKDELNHLRRMAESEASSYETLAERHVKELSLVRTSAFPYHSSPLKTRDSSK